MGMAVKGATQHRVIAKAMDLFLAQPDIEAHQRESAQVLRRRADLGLDRIKRRKKTRAALDEKHAALAREGRT